jgi:hypothetical protein
VLTDLQPRDDCAEKLTHHRAHRIGVHLDRQLRHSVAARNPREVALGVHCRLRIVPDHGFRVTRHVHAAPLGSKEQLPGLLRVDLDSLRDEVAVEAEAGEQGGEERIAFAGTEAEQEAANRYRGHVHDLRPRVLEAPRHHLRQLVRHLLVLGP